MHAGKLNVVQKENLTTGERERASIGLDPIRGNGKQVGEGSGVTGEREGVTGSEMTLELTFPPFFHCFISFTCFLLLFPPSYIYKSVSLCQRICFRSHDILVSPEFLVGFLFIPSSFTAIFCLFPLVIHRFLFGTC